MKFELIYNLDIKMYLYDKFLNKKNFKDIDLLLIDKHKEFKFLKVTNP